jgi:hypothetical protein
MIHVFPWEENLGEAPQVNRPKNDGVVDHEVNGEALQLMIHRKTRTLVDVEMSSNLRLLFMSFT